MHSNETNYSSLFIMTGLIIVLSITALIFGYGTLMNNKSLNWTPAEATIISTNITVHSDDDGTTYTPEIQYRYTYLEDNIKITQTNDRIAFFSLGSGSRNEVERLIKDYPINSIATAYYNPENPNQSILKKAGFWNRIPLPSIGFFIVLIGIYAFRFYIHLKTQKATLFPQTKGIILSATSIEDDEDGIHVEIIYGFIYKDKKYKSRGIGFQANNTVATSPNEQKYIAGSSAEKLLAKYPPKKRVKVYVNPDDPSKSVLEPFPAPYQIFLLWLSGGSVLAVGSAIAYIFISRA